MAMPGGSAAAKRGPTKQGPARVIAASPRYLELSGKVKSEGPAVSSGAMFLMRRSVGTPSRNLARVNAAMSPVVNSQVGLTESGIQPSVAKLRARSGNVGPGLASRSCAISRQNLAPPPKANHCVRSYAPLVIG